MSNKIKRGEIYWVQLDPTIGSEIQKTRPCLVISNNSSNFHSPLITVLPLTTKFNNVRSFEVLIFKGTSNLQNDSKVLAHQIRTVDKKRVTEFIGSIDGETLSKVNQAIKIHLSMDEFDTD